MADLVTAVGQSGSLWGITPATTPRLRIVDGAGNTVTCTEHLGLAASVALAIAERDGRSWLIDQGGHTVEVTPTGIDHTVEGGWPTEAATTTSNLTTITGHHGPQPATAPGHHGPHPGRG